MPIWPAGRSPTIPWRPWVTTEFSVIPRAAAASSPGEQGVPARVPGQTLDTYLDDVERRALTQAIGEVGSKQRDLAHYLGITERSLRYRLGKHRLGGADIASEEEPTKNGSSD